MTSDQFSKEMPDITTEALGWIAQLETGRMTAEDIAALKEWISRSPRHAQEIRKMAKLSEATNVLTGMAGPISAAASERRAAVSARAPKWWARPRIALAAIAVFACASLVGLYTGGPTTVPSDPLVFATDVGGYKEQDLPDGSRVKLNTDSRVQVDFSEGQRTIRLVQGEAYFDVAHDRSSPFVVLAGDRLVEAVGTAFAVRWTDGDLSVTVSEGRVAFSPTNPEFSAQHPAIEALFPEGESETTVSASEPVLLDAGQKISLPAGHQASIITAIATQQIESELSWQNGILDFRQRPLKDIIDEINRYTDVRIEIEDAELGALEFGGIFRTGETDALLDALELAFDIEVDRVSDTHVRVRRTQS